MRRSIAATMVQVVNNRRLRRIIPGKVGICPQIICSFIKKSNHAICIMYTPKVSKEMFLISFPRNAGVDTLVHRPVTNTKSATTWRKVNNPKESYMPGE